MASLIGWIIVGILGLGTLVGVVGIALSCLTLAGRKLGELLGHGRASLQVTPESAAERAPAHAA